MRTLCILLIAVAGDALAQEPAPPPGRFYGPLIPKGDAPKLLPPRLNPPTLGTPLPGRELQRPAISRCAVPLIEMKAPKDIDPAFQITPRKDQVDPMPQAKLPPACEVSPTR
jgi:hypothetical protein